ncbi:MAG TPA: DUF72 domain-containing protein [Mycobacteriales bacterium]|nr:DUF72 domain-containing protein [Mycobacteriales bacterium]
MTTWVGTSGWQYKDWKGRLYPSELPQKAWLEHYAAHFDTVELNNAFYRLPERDTFAAWRQRTPDGFVMAVKASRYLTHIKRLKDPEEPVERLMGRAEALGDRLGPVLLQLPPTLKAEPALLDRTLRCFPAGVRVAVEPRHETWWTDEVRGILERHGATLCWADRRSRPITPLWRTAGWAYLRLHEGRATPWPHYGRDALRAWARRLADTWADEEDAFVYFNNDPGGWAVADAVVFAAESRQLGRTVSHTP